MKKKFLCVALFSLFVFSSDVHAGSFLRGLDKYMPDAPEKSSKTCLACLAKIGTFFVELGKDWHRFLRASDPR